jgi:hypothetical protein
MRDDTYADHDYLLDDVAQDARGSRLAPVLGAVAAMALLAGLIVWSYRLGVRDAQDVPVIRAMVTDIRIAPTDPGGLQVEHQDRRVYDAMAGVVPTPPGAVQIAPGPESLAAEDLPARRLMPETGAAMAETAAEPLPPAVTEIRGIDDLVAAALAEPGPAGEARSPLPPTRPGPAASAVAANPTPVAVTASPFQPGTPAIQLGAYLSAEVAQTMWRTLAARNGDLLAGREPVVNPIVGSTRTLYGLRAAPFATMAEAQGLCAALRARNEDCLVTELR